ncbi:23S rRNA (adenine(1618)-N(6))-methyltransferase RlmF [Maribacter sp. 2210JD10-5]|uniref:23S rRNA (adenine(1618)-N(6))-methyltransferase RlmF n=1 Tax=Maribacter sp. 2210JD10-5 TaxID=3386272 RepID=UPI0039BD7E2C
MKKKVRPTKKSSLHPRNKHRERYNLKTLSKSSPGLSQFILENQYGDESIDFFNADAVKALNKALLIHYYNITFWEIPKGYLCPPIPGRADYLHYMADILVGKNGKVPTGSCIKCLDIGVGANCVYPIIGTNEYGWSFIGADIDPVAIASCQTIIDRNKALNGKVEIRLQKKPKSIFFKIIAKEERFDLTICNPPFHGSQKEAQAGTLRKLRNLKNRKIQKADLNFGGQSNELWTEGGEKAFILRMIKESKDFATSCLWFSTLVSKADHLISIKKALQKVGVADFKVIPMGQGNKKSRVVAWTFFDEKERANWARNYWK